MLEIIENEIGSKKFRFENPRLFNDNGGMGRIYLYDETNQLNEKVILKFIKITENSQIELLKSEFEIALLLNHPNIVKTYCYNTITYNSGSYFYSAMEYCKNGNLRTVINNKKNSKGLTIEQTIKYMCDILIALEYTHQQIIHRDLKPENILIGDNNSLKICDFGISKYINNLTRTQTYKGWGTCSYMAPECWEFKTNTISMDIYSAGIIFFELLTGKIPFNGENENEIKNKHLYEQPPKMLNLGKELPIKIKSLVENMLNKRYGDRYLSKEILEILRNSQTTIDNNINVIANKINKKNNEIKKVDSERQKLVNEELKNRKFVSNRIEILFKLITEIVISINNQLEENKIEFKSSTQERLLFKFLKSELEISVIQNLDNNPDEVILAYGEISIKNRDEVIYGYNIFLKKNTQDDVYGEWKRFHIEKFDYPDQFQLTYDAKIYKLKNSNIYNFLINNNVLKDKSEYQYTSISKQICRSIEKQDISWIMHVLVDNTEIEKEKKEKISFYCNELEELRFNECKSVKDFEKYLKNRFVKYKQNAKDKINYLHLEELKIKNDNEKRYVQDQYEIKRAEQATNYQHTLFTMIIYLLVISVFIFFIIKIWQF